MECRRQMSWLFVLSPPRALQTAHCKTERHVVRRPGPAPSRGEGSGLTEGHTAGGQRVLHRRPLPSMAAYNGKRTVFLIFIQFLPRSQQQVEKGQNWLQTRTLLILIVKRRFKNRSGVTPTWSSQLTGLPDPLSYSSLSHRLPQGTISLEWGAVQPLSHPYNICVGVGGYIRPLSCFIYSLFIPITTAFPLPTSQVPFHYVQCAILGLISFLQSVCGFYLSIF